MSKTIRIVLSALLCAVLLLGAAVPALAEGEPDPVPGRVTAVSMEDITLYQLTRKYRKASLSPVINADEGATYTVTFESSNPKIASVSENGTVIGHRKGAATVTCTVTDENGNTVSGSCTVTVAFNIWAVLLDLVFPDWVVSIILSTVEPPFLPQMANSF